MILFTILAVGLGLGVLFTLLLPQEPPSVQPMNGYLIRRVEMKLVDHRSNPDRSINPNYMVPNMRFTCLEETP